MIDFSVDHPPRTTQERVQSLRSVARLERELGYVDERVADVRLPEPRFEGQRYDAEAPDTLDLTQRAVYAINAYTRMLDPALDYAFIGNAGFMRKPPIVTGAMGHGDGLRAIWPSMSVCKMRRRPSQPVRCVGRSWALVGARGSRGAIL